MAGSTIGFLGAARRHDDAALHPPVHRRVRQIGAARPAHLAARRDGRPDPGLGADPRRDDGHRRRVHGLPPVADVRDQRRPRSPVVTFVGAATALFAATVGTVQNDIKRVIAYSTCSQLGYMFFAAGVGAYGAAMFHLFTHAFFKALLFLGAGCVIHAMHHEQDMRYLRRACGSEIPLTFWAMTGRHAGDHRRRHHPGRGCRASASPASISKDAIIESAFASGSAARRLRLLRSACSRRC